MPGGLSQFMFMEHYLVMAPKIDLELLNITAYTLDVVVLPEDGEEQDKNRVVLGDILQAVIAAFVNEDKVVAEWHWWNVAHDFASNFWMFPMISAMRCSFCRMSAASWAGGR